MDISKIQLHEIEDRYRDYFPEPESPEELLAWLCSYAEDAETGASEAIKSHIMKVADMGKNDYQIAWAVSTAAAETTQQAAKEAYEPRIKAAGITWDECARGKDPETFRKLWDIKQEEGDKLNYDFIQDLAAKAEKMMIEFTFDHMKTCKNPRIRAMVNNDLDAFETMRNDYHSHPDLWEGVKKLAFNYEEA